MEIVKLVALNRSSPPSDSSGIHINLISFILKEINPFCQCYHKHFCSVQKWETS